MALQKLSLTLKLASFGALYLLDILSVSALVISCEITVDFYLVVVPVIVVAAAIAAAIGMCAIIPSSFIF